MSSPQTQYSVPTENFSANSNGDTLYQSTEGNMGVYTSSQNSNSLVINNTGRTVYSNPGSPKPSLMDALRRQDQRVTSYSDSQLPLPVNTDPTLVIADGNHSAYYHALSNSNAHVVMSQMGGVGGPGNDDLPNETCNSRNANKEKLAARMLLSPQSFPVDPLQGGNNVYFQNAGQSQPSSVDLSQLADSGSMGMPGGMCSPPEEGGISSMVTGVGGGGGGIQPPSFQYSQANVFESDMETLLRDVVVTSSKPAYESSSVIPDLELLKAFDSGLDPALLSECLSTPISTDFMGCLDGTSIQPVQALESPLLAPIPARQVASTPTSHTVQGNWMMSAPEQQSNIEDELEIVKMLNVQLKPSAPPANLGLKESVMVPNGHIQSPMRMEGIVPPSPTTPYSPMVPVEASAPSPSPPTPQTPKTPCASQKGPFNLKTYVEDEQRICEISVRDDLPAFQHQIATQAMSFSLETHLKLSQCVKQPCDLKVAIDAKAELCGAKFDQASGKLQFTMPKDCVHLDKWLRVKKEGTDLRDRQLVLQQVTNLLAAVHTLGSKDRLCLWGSIVVWVAPDLRVHLLIDFPDMLCKMETHSSSISFDPRIEDVKAVYDLYQKVFCPYINQDSSWVSPGVNHLIKSFEQLLADPSSVYRMAELARTLGERRLCKLEVELMTLPHYVYCIEHERLASVLSHITSMVPPVECDRWEVQWAETGEIVGREVMASAHRRMRLLVQPVIEQAGGFVPLSRHAISQGLSFRGSCLPQF